jgi:glutathione S-transferase
MMKLYYSENLNPRVAVATARHLAAPVEFVRASPRDPNNEGAFRPINPNTLVPVLVENGRSLWETDAIACRLSMLTRPDFWCRTDEAPDFQRWLSWSAHYFTQISSVFYWENLMKPKLGMGGADLAAVKEATAAFHRFAQVLEETLASRIWLVGDRLTYADFRVATGLPFAEAAKLPLDTYPLIRAWHGRLWALPAWSRPFDGLG